MSHDMAVSHGERWWSVVLMVLNPGVVAVSLTLLIAAFFSSVGYSELSSHFDLTGMAGVRLIGVFVGIDMLFAYTWMIMLALAAPRLTPFQEDMTASAESRRRKADRTRARPHWRHR